jgi:iron-sulfur cluster repair protein YtfE (RIC family)
MAAPKTSRPAELIEELSRRRAALRTLLRTASELAAAVVLEQRPPSCGTFLSVRRLFLEFDSELQSHLDQEETALQLALESFRTAGQQPADLPETVRLLIRGQEAILYLVSDISEATREYETPADACACYAAFLEVLRALHKELLRHFQLAYDHLFPDGLRMTAPTPK